ncbi:MAG: ATP-binding protein [Lachnospiraceae bacterium]|nr:ATP-binding protein [Lachnospiraceae bacterium]
MEMYVTDITCLLFLLFISIVYLGVKRTPTHQHRLFKIMLLCSFVNIVSDMVGSFCKFSMNRKSLDELNIDMFENMAEIEIITRRNFVADLSNCFYIVSLLFFFYTIYIYVKFLMTGEIAKKLSKLETIMLCPFIIICILALFGKGNMDHAADDISTWSIGTPLTPICAAFYILAGAYFIIKYWKNVTKTQKMAVIMAMVSEIVVTIVQAEIARRSGMRIAGIGIVLMDFSFYMTVESPDALIIERLKYEKERADDANNAKSAFLANMSHEIRTPMNAIVGMTEILLRTDLNDQQKGCLYNIKHSGNSLLLIINDLLDFSKIEAGKMELVNENYDPISILNDVSMIVLNRIGDKPVDLFYDVDKNLPAKLYGDSGRVKQIIINLMNNAVKFTDAGYVKLTVSVLEKVGKNVTLKFDVKDTGQGIKEEDLGKLFETFKQVDMARNRKKEGTGLGLSISKQLAKLMGGDVSVTSVYGEGSTFSFTIKQKIIDERPCAQLSEEYDGKSLRIGGWVCEQKREHVEKLLEDFRFRLEVYDSNTLPDADADYILVDDECYERNKEILHELAENVSVTVLYNPMKNVYADGKINFVAAPLYSSKLVKIINREKEDLEGANPEEIINFSAPDAKILLVDDTDMNLKVAVGLLAPLNMKIDVARSGKESIEKAQRKQYDIIFMDHMMPGMDGVEASRKIRELEVFEGYYKDSPIIALTANANMEAKELFKQSGVEELVTKPIEIAQLAKAIRRHLPAEMIQKPVKLTQLNPLQMTKAIPAIVGINAAEGIKNSGSRELFENLLGDFYKLIDMKSTKIEKCLEDGMIRDFTIEVHALKNTARMIGATELSEMFKEMEELGHEERLEEVQRRIPEVLSKFREYKTSLSPFASLNDDNKVEVSKEEILHVLNDIKDAMENFDVDRADADMKTLDTYKVEEAARPLMENLSAYMADLQMEEVISTCEDLISLISMG